MNHPVVYINTTTLVYSRWIRKGMLPTRVKSDRPLTAEEVEEFRISPERMLSHEPEAA